MNNLLIFAGEVFDAHYSDPQEDNYYETIYEYLHSSNSVNFKDIDWEYKTLLKSIIPFIILLVFCVVACIIIIINKPVVVRKIKKVIIDSVPIYIYGNTVEICGDLYNSVEDAITDVKLNFKNPVLKNNIISYLRTL